MDYLRKELEVQCTVPVSDIATGELDEEPGPETSHSAQNLHAP